MLGVQRDVENGTAVTLGFDGSYDDDSTCIVGCTVEDVPHIFVIKAWERPYGANDWVVPREEVDVEIERCFEKWDVLELACDRAKWFKEFTEWVARYGEDVVMTFPQTPIRMSEASKALKTRVKESAGAIDDGEPVTLTHDGDPRLARHLANAVPKQQGVDAVYIVKDGPNSPRKIDIAVAAVMAHHRALWHASNRVEWVEPFVIWR